MAEYRTKDVRVWDRGGAIRVISYDHIYMIYYRSHATDIVQGSGALPTQRTLAHIYSIIFTCHGHHSRLYYRLITEIHFIYYGLCIQPASRAYKTSTTHNYGHRISSSYLEFSPLPAECQCAPPSVHPRVASLLCSPHRSCAQLRSSHRHQKSDVLMKRASDKSQPQIHGSSGGPSHAPAGPGSRRGKFSPFGGSGLCDHSSESGGRCTVRSNASESTPRALDANDIT